MVSGIGEKLSEYVSHKKEDARSVYVAKRAKLAFILEALQLKKEAGPDDSEVVKYAGEE